MDSLISLHRGSTRGWAQLSGCVLHSPKQPELDPMTHLREWGPAQHRFLGLEWPPFTRLLVYALASKRAQP